MWYNFKADIEKGDDPLPIAKHKLAMPQGKHIFGTVKVGEKGQIVIPKEARDLFGIGSGDTLLVLGDEKNGIFITKPEAVSELAIKLFDSIDTAKEKGSEDKL